MITHIMSGVFIFFKNIAEQRSALCNFILNNCEIQTATRTMNKEFYNRRLPHWQPTGAVFDICFRLAGSLPKEKWHQLKETRDHRLKELQKTIENEEERKLALQKEHDFYFGKYDKMLDECDFGPTWLKQSEIAEIVVEAFHFRHNEGIFKLICFSIMPNHVHAIIYKTQKPLFRVLQSLKNRTGNKANAILNREGLPFWHPESYDHVIRNRGSLKRKINYQLQNPVEADLCAKWSDWNFNYLNPEFSKFLT